MRKNNQNNNEQIEYALCTFRALDQGKSKEILVMYMAIIEFCKARPEMKLNNFKEILEKEMPTMKHFNLL